MMKVSMPSTNIEIAALTDGVRAPTAPQAMQIAFMSIRKCPTCQHLLAGINQEGKMES